jgi:hypothetical protein
MSLLAEAMTSHDVPHTTRDVIHASENPEVAVVRSLLCRAI